MRAHVGDEIWRHIGATGWRVYLDGNEIHDCFEFDTDEGWAKCYKRQDGNICLENPDDPDSGPAIETLHGKILVVAKANREERQARALERIADAVERYLNLIAPQPAREPTPPEPKETMPGLWSIDGVNGVFYTAAAALAAWPDRHKKATT